MTQVIGPPAGQAYLMRPDPVAMAPHRIFLLWLLFWGGTLAAQPLPGLRAAFPLDGDFTDAGPYGYSPGWISGTQDTTGHDGLPGHGLHFDGLDDFAAIPAQSLHFLWPTFTLSFWVRPHDAPGSGGEQVLVEKWSWDYVNVPVNFSLVRTPAGQIRLRRGGGRFPDCSPQSATHILSDTLPPHQYSHVAVVRQQDSISFYLNSVHLATVEDTHKCSLPNEVLYLGQRDPASMYAQDAYFHGDLDELLILETALSPAALACLSSGAWGYATDTLCAGDSLYGLGQSGQYSLLLPGSSGCDSLLFLDLLVHPPADTQWSAAICAGMTYGFGGLPRAQPGTYHDTFLTATGCPAVATLHLTVHPQDTLTTYAGLCPGDSLWWAGNWYRQPGSYTLHLSNQWGCDSTLRLNLNPQAGYRHVSRTTICAGDTFWFQGQAFTATGWYADTLPTAAGCDSILALDLRVLSPPDTAIVSGGQLIAPAGADTYAWRNCLTGLLIPGARGPVLQPPGPGLYQVIGRSGNCADSSACIAYPGPHPQQVWGSAWMVYPNPFLARISLDRPDPGIPGHLSLYDMQGRLLRTAAFPAGAQPSLPGQDLPAGLYHLQWEDAHHRRSWLVEHR